MVLKNVEIPAWDPKRKETPCLTMYPGIQAAVTSLASADVSQSSLI
jgi:hypothetical protein